MSHLSNYELCEIKEISPFYRRFNQYKNQELMFTVTFFILLMYLEEFLFVFQYLLVRMGYARPFIIQMTIFETKDQISPIDSHSSTEDS